ncbi:hypothetical protein [Flavobacterium sp. DSR3-2]|uniref:hypothetical protein n=1 Tax=Flavobacterium sp. DSR3-2 TaxID=2804634 RepID=UPI003CE698A3
MWLPPVSKPQNGPVTIGKDASDYFDFGNYNQNGSIETRFDCSKELLSLITKVYKENIQVNANVVLSRNIGGKLENNSFIETQTYTNFTAVVFGKYK